jgi:hypothetical protein
MSELRNEARATDDKETKGKLLDQAMGLARKTLEQYRDNPQSPEVVAERKRSLLKKIHTNVERGTSEPKAKWLRRKAAAIKNKEQARDEYQELGRLPTVGG